MFLIYKNKIMHQYVIQNLQTDDLHNFNIHLEEISNLLEIDLSKHVTCSHENSTIVLEVTPSFFTKLKLKIREKKEINLLVGNLLADQIMFDAAPTPQTKLAIKQAAEAFLEEAKDFCQQASVTSERLLPLVSLLDLNPANYTSLLSQFVSLGYKSIVVAEGSHGYYSPLKFMMENTAFLKQLEAVVVIEDFVKEVAQDEMDACTKNQHYSTYLRNITPHIPKSSLPEAMQKFAEEKFEMLNTLCSAGITMIAGDVESSQGWGPTKERLIVGNYAMIQNCKNYLIQHNIKDPIVIYYTGAVHAITSKKCIGVADLVGGVCIELHDNYKHNAKSRIETDKHRIKVTLNLTDLQPSLAL